MVGLSFDILILCINTEVLQNFRCLITCCARCRRCAWSSSTPLRRHNRILVPPVTSTTVGSRAFPVAASLIWNSLPDDVISAESLSTFQRKLKRHLFCQSFPGFCYWHLHLQWTLQWQCHLGHSKNTMIDWLIDLFILVTVYCCVFYVLLLFVQCWPRLGVNTFCIDWFNDWLYDFCHVCCLSVRM